MLYGTQDRDFFPRNFVDRLNYIKELGYDYVTLDLEGFRSGSQDIKLEEK